MNRKGTIIAIVAIALMLAGIAWAVSRLYRDDKPRQASVNTEYPLLRAVPADAAAVFCFDGTSTAQRAIADSIVERKQAAIRNSAGAPPTHLS